MDVPPKGARIAAYYRCSTAGQEHSVADQRKVVQKEAERHGWTVIEEYEDQGESGATIANRPGLLRLLRDAASGRFDFVVVYDLSRLTRGGVAPFWALVNQFDECRIRMFCCAQRKLATEENAFLFTADAAQARRENAKRSRDVSRTHLENVAHRNQDPGRRAPFGFDHLRVETDSGKPVERIRFLRDGRKQIMAPDGNTVIRTLPKGEKYRKGASLRVVLVPSDVEDTTALRLIFDLSATRGATYIANHLNVLGHRAPKGGNWSYSTIRGILDNPAYLGHRAYCRRIEGRYHTLDKDGVEAFDELDAGKMHYGYKPQKKWVTQDNTHEPLVATDTFRIAHEGRRGRRTRHAVNRKAKNQQREYLLSGGFIQCGRRDAEGKEHGFLNGRTSQSRGHAYPQYQCSHYKRYGRSVCAPYALPMEAMDAFVMSELAGVLTAPECLDALRTGLEQEYHRMARSRKPLDNTERERLKAERDALERARRQITDAVVKDPASMALMKPEIERLAAEGMALERKLQETQAVAELPPVTSWVERGLAFYRERVVAPLADSGTGGKEEETTVVAGTQGQEPSKGNDGAPMRSGGRACVAELKELFRLIGLQIRYDPDTKEGTLDFSPFV